MFLKSLKGHSDFLKKIPLSWFFIAIAMSLILFLLLFINFSFILRYFPINKPHIDFSSHMTRIHFMRTYGFNKVPNWYNGFYPFKAYYFAYYIFALPFYIVSNSLNITIFVSVILIYLFSFIGCLFFSKIKNGLDKRRSIVFFILFFFNPVMLFDSLNLGRLPELLGWMVFLFQTVLVFYYKNKRIGFRFIIGYSILTAMLILSETMIYFLSLALLFGLFLIKNLKERIKIVLSFLISLSLTSIWWMPIIEKNYSQIESFYGVRYLKETFISPNSLLFLLKNWYHDLAVIAFLFAVFCLINYSKDSVKNYLFFAPSLLLSILYLFKITYFIPIISITYHLIFVYFFWFLFLYIILTIDISSLTLKLRSVILFFLYHSYIPLIFYLLFFANIRSFAYDNFDKQIIQLSDSIDKKFVVVPNPKYANLYYPSIVSYITFKTNATTSMGWVDQNANDSVRKLNTKIIRIVQQNDCNKIKNLFRDEEIKYILTFGEYCDNLLKCDFVIKRKTEDCCVLEFY